MWRAALSKHEYINLILLQYQPLDNVNDNISKIELLLKKNNVKENTLVVCPELSLQHYVCITKSKKNISNAISLDAKEIFLIKNIAIQSQKSKSQINIYGNDYNTKDGTCVRDYMHIADLADIHLKTLKNISINNKSLILNCGYGKGYSVQEIVSVFRNLKKNVIVKYKARRPGDVAQIYANTSKIKRILKWRPKYNNIKKIIISAINWEKKLTK